MKPRNFSTFKIPRSPKIHRDAKSKTGVDQNPDIPQPLIPQAAALAPPLAGYPDVGLLRASWANNPFELTSVLLNNWSDGDYVVLVLNGNETMRSITPEEVLANRITFEIPAPRDEGSHVARFCYEGGLIGDRTGFTSPVRFYVKTTIPGAPALAALELPEDVKENGLSDEILAGHNDVLPCEIKSYSYRADGDLITVTITNEDSGNGDTADARIPVNGMNDPLFVNVTRDQIETLGDGTYSLTYLIEDLAGNVSPSSTTVTIPVYVNEGITNLDPPIVPLYDDDDLISEIDARAPVHVDIPRNSDILDGDQIVVHWEGEESDPWPVTNAGGTGEPLESVPIPYELVQASASAGGDVAIDVNYEVFRAGRSIGSPPTATPVVVNLDQAGGEDPDPTTPENEALGSPIVRNDGWTSGDPDNKIPVEDSAKDAAFIVPWENTLTPGGPSFLADDVIELYYGVDPIGNPTAQPFFNYTVTANDVAPPPDNFNFVLPATKIAEFGSGDFPASYSVTRVVREADTGAVPPVTEVVNVAYSLKPDVSVDSAAELPGGGNPIDAPLFKTNFGYPRPHDLGYQPVYIQPYDVMAEGDTLELHITGKFGRDGSGGPVNKAEFGHTGDTPIPGFPTTYNVERLDVGHEIEMKYPWERISYLYPICQVFVEVKVSNSKGSKLSEESTVLVDNRLDPTPPDDPDRP